MPPRGHRALLLSLPGIKANGDDPSENSPQSPCQECRILLALICHSTSLAIHILCTHNEIHRLHFISYFLHLRSASAGIRGIGRLILRVSGITNFRIRFCLNRQSAWHNTSSRCRSSSASRVKSDSTRLLYFHRPPRSTYSLPPCRSHPWCQACWCRDALKQQSVYLAPTKLPDRKSSGSSMAWHHTPFHWFSAPLSV